jgi:hypothetical protein
MNLETLSLEYCKAASIALGRGQKTVSIRGSIKDQTGCHPLKLCLVQSQTLAEASNMATFTNILLSKVGSINYHNKKIPLDPTQVLDSTDPNGAWVAVPRMSPRSESRLLQLKLEPPMATI